MTQAVEAGRGVIVSSLIDQRDHVLGALEGLSDDDLRRPVLPSGWTCLELVHHLAIDVERFWFRSIVAGEAVEFTKSPKAGWDVPSDMSAKEVLDFYRHEIDMANDIIASTSLHTPPARWPNEWTHWRLEDLRAILLHVITETACHAGHLDVARELIDGKSWLILTG